MSILDQVLENTTRRSARIVSQEHDLSKIQTGSNGDDPTGIKARIASLRNGGPWDAAEYGISREEQIAKLEAADTPEAQERAMAELRQRAIRRASLDTSNGRVSAMFAGRPAWHGLGVVVDQAATSKEAIVLAGLNWRAEKIPLTYEWEGRTFVSEETFAIIRADTGKQLGTVGSKYQPIQNEDGFDFLDAVLASYGARYESAGSLYGGKRVWLLAYLPEQRFSVQPGDEIEPYVLFSNCHDGSGSAWVLPTTVRVECANTYRIALRGKAKGMSIRHTGSVHDKMESARDVLGLTVESVSEYRETAEQMVRTTCDIQHYANDVLDTVLDVTEADALKGADLLAAMLQVTEAERELAQKAFARKIARRSEILEDILERHESERCHPKGTVWAIKNAVDEHADHFPQKYRSRDQETRLSRRFESILVGEADEMKQVAFQKATALL